MVRSFSHEFFAEVASGLFAELPARFVLSLIPLVDHLARGLAAAVSATMAWRVGTMVAIYYYNGARWIGGPRETYERAKVMTGTISADDANRVDLNDIPREIPEVYEHLVEQTALYVKNLRRSAPDAGDATIRSILRDNGFAEDVAEAAIAKVLARPEEAGHTRRGGIASGDKVSVVRDLVKQLFAGRPDEDAEQHLVAIGRRSDELRAVMREELQSAIRAFVTGLTPADPSKREFLSVEEKRARSAEKRRHVNLINGLLERFGFGIWAENKLCYLKHRETASHPAGEVLLIRTGSNKEAGVAGELWKLEPICVVDRLSLPPGPAEEPETPRPPSSRPDRIRQRGTGRPPGRFS